MKIEEHTSSNGRNVVIGIELIKPTNKLHVNEDEQGEGIALQLVTGTFNFNSKFSDIQSNTKNQ